jgi:hypothetical protein
MFSRPLKILTLALALIAVTGCSSSQLPGLAARRWHCDRDDRLVGTWSTGLAMSQLGPGSERVIYNCDCTYEGRSTILLLIFPIRATETGWYTAANGLLVTEGGQFSSRSEMRYHFEGKTLVVELGAPPQRFYNVRLQSCKDKTVPPLQPTSP